MYFLCGLIAPGPSFAMDMKPPEDKAMNEAVATGRSSLKRERYTPVNSSKDLYRSAGSAPAAFSPCRCGAAPVAQRAEHRAQALPRSVR